MEDTVLIGMPASKHLVANVCHYGIITTNGKNLIFKGFQCLSRFYSIPFPKLKYGEKIDEKKEAVTLKTKLSSASGPAF